MSEQIVDLRSAWAILRRHGRALGVAAVLGATAGGAVAYLLPGTYTSTSVVLLPATPANGASQLASHDIDTQIEIARSSSVLGRAGQMLHPPLGADKVADRVEIVAQTTDVLRITARGGSAAAAEALSKAVAQADVDYLQAASSSLTEAQRTALANRIKTLKKSLASVTSELKKTSDRLRKDEPGSTAARADASAFAELTAQQANMVLQIDEIQKEATAGGEPLNGQPGGGTRVIQPASPGQRPSFIARTAMFAGVGLGVVVLGAATYLVLTGRREKTLRSRDQIADAIGIPVVASIQARAPRVVAGWVSLLASYAPEDVDMWTLRQLIRVITPGTPRSLSRQPDPSADTTRVVILTLSDDSQALAVGPQLASFAAATGVGTQLVAAQPHETATALWAACARVPEDVGARPGLLVDTRLDRRYGGDLVVYVAVMDRRRPSLYLYGADEAVVLLAVTTGSATADDLARIAVAADDAGSSIDGLIVVNPDALDRTTGRLLPSERVQQVPLPTLMTGSPATGGATASTTARRPR